MFVFLPVCLSSEESCGSFGLSMNSSAGLLSPADVLDAGSGPKMEPLNVSMLGENLETLKGRKILHLVKVLNLVSICYFYRHRRTDLPANAIY